MVISGNYGITIGIMIAFSTLFLWVIHKKYRPEDYI